MPIDLATTVPGGMKPLREFTKAVTPTLVAGRPWSLWGLGGNPAAGAFDNTLNGVVLNNPTNGQIPFINPSGSEKAYLANFVAACGQGGVVQLCDRLWHNGNFNITTVGNQAIAAPTFPARDANESTNGEGVLLGMEVSVVTGAGTPTITILYTNQAGTAARSGTNILATVAASAAGSFYKIGLQAGDTGVRTPTQLNLSATWTSGTINLVAYRQIATIPLIAGGIPGFIDALTGGLQKMPSGAVPFLIFTPSTTTAISLSGSFIQTNFDPA